ncbi:MAG TPA: cell division protein FtsQ/DivIB [Burkholderiaceae bacterium]|jgi:cell division protein FtsQ|nr:cell division protein FtsQ/DivIB [Burkholderiaceae bacterium]
MPTPDTALDIRLMNAAARALFALAMLAFAGLALVWVTRAPMFQIRAIRVEGDVGRNNASTIRANAATRLAGNFFSIDLTRAQAAFESVPWVRRAVVRRVWPDRLAVTLEEHRAAAWWHTEEGDDKLVNRQGEVFEANPGDVEDDGLPTLSGPDGSSPAMLDLYRRLKPVLAPLGAQIDTLTLSARGSWTAELDNGAVIEIGRGTPQELLARCDAFVSTLTQVTSRYQRPLEYADLRHRDGYALRLRGVGTVQPAQKKTN